MVEEVKEVLEEVEEAVVAVVELAAASYLREREEGLVLAVAFEDHLDLAGDEQVAVGAGGAIKVI